jgi:chemotaxis protein methyltransferase CheR
MRTEVHIYPLLLGVLGSILLLSFSPVSLVIITSALFLTGLGLLFGLWTHQALSSINTQLVELKSQVNTQNQANKIINNTDKLCLAVFPIWSRQIETTRKQTETATTELANNFSLLVESLSQAFPSHSNLNNEQDNSIEKTFSFSEKALNSVMASLQATHIDLLTTHETFFFREPKHFDFIRDIIIPTWNSVHYRVWSAASSSGEEAYTLAMILAEHAGNKNWEIVGTDISTQILDRARSGHYAIERADNIPKNYLTKYCLKGTGQQQGTFIMCPELRQKVQFIHANLKDNLSQLGSFDVIFLRNVLIYFDIKTKQQVVTQLLRQLKPNGYFIVGHSESLNGVVDNLKVIVPSVYQKR